MEIGYAPGTSEVYDALIVAEVCATGEFITLKTVVEVKIGAGRGVGRNPAYSLIRAYPDVAVIAFADSAYHVVWQSVIGGNMKDVRGLRIVAVQTVGCAEPQRFIRVFEQCVPHAVAEHVQSS